MVGVDRLNIDQFNEIFDACGGDLDRSTQVRLRSKCYSNDDSRDIIASSNRCIYWRYFFGLLSSRSTTTWVSELKSSVVGYAALKKEIFPSITNVGFDPLSDNNSETLMYFERVEKVKSIELDLNRLYITGIDDEYFHTKKRKNVLLSVLLIWSVLHPQISYRQGMKYSSPYVYLRSVHDYEDISHFICVNVCRWRLGVELNDAHPCMFYTISCWLIGAANILLLE